MKLVRAILIFYKKLILPSLIMSTILGFSGRYISAILPFDDVEEFPLFSLDFFAIALIGSSMAFQYIIYEARNSHEYYFYYNLGLNKLTLWISNLLITSLISLGLLTL